MNPVTASSDPLAYLARVESNARTYASSFPRMMSRARGAWISDSEGRDYLDCLANAGTLALGHNHPEVQAAVQIFLAEDRLQQALDLATPAKLAFVARLLGLLPEAMRDEVKIQFCGPTGADAVEAALKLCRYHTGRQTVWAFHGGYHGMTAGALAAMGNLAAKSCIATHGVHFLPYPYRYRCPFGTDGGATDGLSLSYIENLLVDGESGVEKPAAILLEVVQGEGGCIPASDEWLRGLRALTERHDIPLVVDEVQTGLGRTGRMFAFEHAGIVPDVLVLSKAIGGGYPLAVVIYQRRLDSWLPGMHAGTFRGNQIAMVAGLATIEVIERDGLAARAQRLGDQLRASLRSIALEFPFLGDVRGRGLMLGVEVIDASGHGRRGAPDGGVAKAIKRGCFERGLIIETGGRDGAVLRFLPPLTISEDELGMLLQRFTGAVRAAAGAPPTSFTAAAHTAI